MYSITISNTGESCSLAFSFNSNILKGFIHRLKSSEATLEGMAQKLSI